MSLLRKGLQRNETDDCRRRCAGFAPFASDAGQHGIPAEIGTSRV